MVEQQEREEVTMRIAVISDTHLQNAEGWFEKVFVAHLAPADAVLHCGDVTGAPLLHYLMQHPEFYAIAGNMDRYGLDRELPDKRELELDGLRVGLTHGFGFPFPISKHLPQAFSEGLDLICFGHTHVFKDTVVDGVRILNPGSMTSPRQGPRSMAMVQAKGRQIERIEQVVLE